MNNLLSDLDNRITIEEASVDIMTFLVQDLLDFAQIKSGKFRKGLKKFNLRESVGKVVAI